MKIHGITWKSHYSKLIISSIAIVLQPRVILIIRFSKVPPEIIQPCSKLYIRLLHKPYVYRVTLTRQNLSLKCNQFSWAESMLTMGSRSFQRGNVGLCMSKGLKVTSCQSWRFNKKFCRTARVKPHECGPRFESQTTGSFSKFEWL